MARGVQHRTGLPAALLHTSLERECPVIASAQWEIAQGMGGHQLDRPLEAIDEK